jgi:hypothetical protein
MASTLLPFDHDVVAATERFRELNAKMVTVSKQTGIMLVDTYDQAVSDLLEFAQKLADSTKVEQISGITRSQVSIVDTVMTGYTQAARELLK